MFYIFDLNKACDRLNIIETNIDHSCFKNPNHRTGWLFFQSNKCLIGVKSDLLTMEPKDELETKESQQPMDTYNPICSLLS